MNIYIGYDSREEICYDVMATSITKYSEGIDYNVLPLKQEELRTQGLYWRDRNEPASTEFAFTRFLIPALEGYKGWAAFVDCDMIVTESVGALFSFAKPEYAVCVVKHEYTPRFNVKMDGQKQVNYPRKNWSSVILWNCGHESNRQLTVDKVNVESPAWLHRFSWLKDEEIGELPVKWNWLEGDYDKPNETPSLIHYTNGGPWFKEVRQARDIEYGDLWVQYAENLGYELE